MTILDSFARNLKAERRRKNLSQEALAAKAELSTSYISMLEREQRSPTLGTLEQLGKALGLQPVALLQAR